MIILVAGPQGSGKTKVAEELKAKYPDHTIIDEWHGGVDIQQDSIVLTSIFDKVYLVEKDNPALVE